MATQELELDGDRRPQVPSAAAAARKPLRPLKPAVRLKLHPGTATPLAPRRKGMAVARLGGRRRGWRWRGRRVVAGILRRLRLRWLAEQYRRALKKLREYHAALMRDLIESAASLEAAQSRIMMESSYLANPFLTVTPASSRACYYAR